MNPLVEHIANGQAFFSGTAAVLGGVSLTATAEKRVTISVGRVLTGAGLLLVLASATPLHWFAYVVGIVATAAGLFVARRNHPHRRTLLIFVSVVWLGLALVELRWHVLPPIPTVTATRLDVIGDSVSAGVGGPDEATWPRRIARDHGIDVRDHSAVGATAKTAWEQAAKIEPGPSLVFIEIGGNRR